MYFLYTLRVMLPPASRVGGCGIGGRTINETMKREGKSRGSVGGPGIEDRPKNWLVPATLVTLGEGSSHGYEDGAVGSFRASRDEPGDVVGVAGPRHALIRSVSEDMLRYANRAVLVVGGQSESEGSEERS